MSQDKSPSQHPRPNPPPQGEGDGYGVDVQKLSGLTQDSRKVKPGFLFAAFPGETVDGRDYIDAAIENGASVILTDSSVPPLRKQGPSVQIIHEDNPRKAFAHLCAAFYDKQPEIITAVTGTNGKTSTVHFTEQLWAAQSLNAASIGTLKGGMTTLDPVALHEKLTALQDEGITHLAMEASSHGLAQYRMDGAKISAAGFTNLSRDHLDYHDTMEDYLAAKTRLFTDILKEDGTAVINADNDEGQSLIESCQASGRRVWSYGHNGRQIKIVDIKPQSNGQSLSVDVFGKAYDLTIPLVGEFQIMNALCALGLVLAGQGMDRDHCVMALENLNAAPGRLQYIEHPSGAAIYVDYAHTPDALEHVLTALRPHAANKLICLFGCGGDRDTGKRKIMGEIATNLADQIIVTDDNPRGEDAASIRAAILDGAPNATQIEDRRKAIQDSVASLNEGEILLIAGKGHEQGQIFATHTDPFDDVTEVKQAITTLTPSPSSCGSTAGSQE